ncbi:MAG: hypothetical protein AAF573_05640 [Bacteroidota bacterium]
MKKSLGSKRKEISQDQRSELIKIYAAFKESEHCKIFDNPFFGYTKVTVEQPARNELGDIVTNKKG